MLHLLSFVVIHFLYVLNFLAQGAGLVDSTTGTYPEQRKGVWTYSISQCLWQLCRGHKNACICWRSQGKALIEFSVCQQGCIMSCVRFSIIWTLLPFSIFYFYTHSNCSFTGYDTRIPLISLIQKNWIFKNKIITKLIIDSEKLIFKEKYIINPEKQSFKNLNSE